ncbi:cytochrome bo3 quinol oxidase subunit 4 [Sphingomonas sp. OV641]|uniref:cytochrome o ubiquinol oxidase subunit IV n=1 Tax=Sphingomonas sp. OV641 TaxID=1881068 RepID=UPI0008AE0F41|nr:cytochrome o ubiquinol oxidase subunit IV [Sphingomonas sp. OV641]SEJ82148.1 cytochrome bo3 quinol oxidase subunit 4 [Sphingomonas sp. OV641]
MSAPHAHADTHGHGHADDHHHAPAPDGGHGHGSRRGYVIGFLLSAVLTAVPFWLVMTGALASVQATAIIVVALAFVQIVVHTFFFLHLNPRAEGGWTLLAFIFTVIIIAIVIAGSLWIMFHLNSNMMPMDGMGM